MLHMERVNSQMYHILQMFIIFYASCYLQNGIAKFVPPEMRFFTIRR